MYTGQTCEKCKDWHNNLDLKAENYAKNFPLTKNPFKKWHVNCKCSCHIPQSWSKLYLTSSQQNNGLGGKGQGNSEKNWLDLRKDSRHQISATSGT